MRNSFWLRLGVAAVFVGLAAASINLPARAQQPPPLSLQQNPLGLTPGQQTKIQAIQQSAQAKSQVIQSNTKLTKDQQTQQLKDLQTWYLQQTHAVLTPKQMALLSSRQATIKSKSGEYQALQSKLMASLSTKQKADIKAIQTDENAQIKVLIANKALTNQQKQTQFQALQMGGMGKINGVLTPTQLQMVSQLKSLQGQIQQIVGRRPGPQ